MSGWIKFWKDMATDPRMVSAASKLASRYEVLVNTPGGAEPLSRTDTLTLWRNAVTGALVTLWCFADEYVTEENALAVSSDTVDTIVGLRGFFSVISRDWVDELDDGRVILPGYCKKNSLITKRKRTIQSNARVTRWRAAYKSNGNGVTTHDVTQCDSAGDIDKDLSDIRCRTAPRNACVTALPTALQEVRRKARAKRASPVPLPDNFILTEAMIQQATKLAPGCDVEEWFQQFCAHHRAHGKVMLDWTAAWRTWVSNGVKFGYPRQQEAPGAAIGLPLFQG